MNLGIALLRQGGLIGDAARLSEAVAACRAAQEVYRREQAPQDWAATQMSL